MFRHSGGSRTISAKAAGRLLGVLVLLASLAVTAAPPTRPRPAAVSFLAIRIADADETFAAEAGLREGLRVRLVGIVTRSSDPRSGVFGLTRFYYECCKAYAVPVTIPVDARRVGQEAVRRGSWLAVTGAVDRRARRIFVVADRIRSVPKPLHPYLSFHS